MDALSHPQRHTPKPPLRHPLSPPLTETTRAALDGLSYTGAPLDRAEPLRTDTARLAALRADPSSRLVLVWRDRVLIDGTEDEAAPALVTAPGTWSGPTPDLAPEEEVLLGLDTDGTAWFALQLPQGPESEDDLGPHTGLGGQFLPLRTVGPTLPGPEATLLAQALGVLGWHRRHRFCGACGALCESVDAGYRRRCTTCGADHFPRTDPAVIMLIHHGRGAQARCLLGHGPRLPSGMISTLAGFVEPGETLEEAVRREVHEEAGIRVGRVAYGASQPWPFPASLMLGFHGEALTTDIVIDPRELDHAGWYTRAEVASFMQGEGSDGPAPWRLPRADSLGRRLILGWLKGDPFDE
ncbi:NAD(+) diphosphatase [Roseospira marina]|uniref:NAD(+) diphosphatase n=1 Tax=Roseospira marina TaxID=140057 RepID=A0A5M6ICT0_9PROT|nr:NAD(+) diphosphatase [Roseospira marina]KAA5606084.1 NAD(+) diphosphatase [Roseospira marina]MBB4313050.1 NAD+ diphosphatase [Roseospira marina]MBB5086209.1 NAD+ diphosphatase [Roseospira marina]